jgi:hypothetical protein
MERDSRYSFIRPQSITDLPNILNIVLPAGKAKSSVETLFLPPSRLRRDKIKSL